MLWDGTLEDGTLVTVVAESEPVHLLSELSGTKIVSSDGQELGIHSELDIKFELDEELKEEPQDCSMDYDDADNEPAQTDGQIEAEALHTSQPSKELQAPQFTIQEPAQTDGQIEAEALHTSQPSKELQAPQFTIQGTAKKKADLLRVDCCTTDFILNFIYSSKSNTKRNYVNKQYVIGLGRARPMMKIDYKRTDGYFRNFNSSLYDRYSWMTGSCKLNKMFCFPCLLFSTSCGVWSKNGFSDINNLSKSARTHVQTQNHIQSCLALYDYGKTKSDSKFSKTFVEHNRKVDRNRELMKRFIDTVVLLAKLEMPVHGHDETCDSKNRGNYIETLTYLSDYDAVLSSHLEQFSETRNPVFSGLSSDTQNELISCVASVIRDAINLEISETRFVSVMIDETPDVREQISAILRYVTETGVEERFVGFFDVSGSRNADVISELLLNILEQYDCKHKLVGLSYDGAAITPGEHDALHAKLIKECPMVVFVPCYAHNLNVVLSRSLENVQELKMFFGSINSIVRFFNESSKRSKLLKEIAGRRLQGVSDIRWHCHSRIVNVIFDCKTDMAQTFEAMLDPSNSSEWDGETLSIAESLLHKLNDMQFCFLLRVFSDVFRRTDKLFAILQSQQVDIKVAQREIDTFIDWVTQKFQNQFHSIYESVQGHSENADSKTLYQRLFKDIINNIKTQIEQRYRKFSQLTFLDLINKTKYASYRVSFPEYKSSALLSQYPGKFDSNTLKNELKVLSSTTSLNHLDTYELYLHLKSSHLNEILPQTYCLCTLLLTLPVTVASGEKSLSALKRIHTHVRNGNTQKEEKLADLDLISMEIHLLMRLKGKSNFYDNVFTHFVKKSRSLALEYK